MRRIAVIMTVFNRVDKTCRCLDSLAYALTHRVAEGEDTFMDVDIYVTDDGSTDSTGETLAERYGAAAFKLNILPADGTLFWNGGMNNSWRAAIGNGGYDGYLWLNNDVVLSANVFSDLMTTDDHCKRTCGKGGIYVGSCTADGERLTYGGFCFADKWTLRERFVTPNGDCQPCQCAHGNVTYVSSDVVEEMGVLCEEYIHGGGDHDYTYKAYKAGFPILVMPRYVATCENDHRGDGYYEFMRMPLSERIEYLKSPVGFNLHNTLVFQRRCFPHRYLFVWTMSYLKTLFPKAYFYLFRLIHKPNK